MNINYDLGVIKRKHSASGIDVYMYVNEPGVFRTAYGTEVSADLAKAAGFDVEVLAKERLKRSRMAAAMAAIEAELADPADPVQKVLAERGGYKVVAIGLGRTNVLDPDGHKLNSVYLPEAEAVKLIEHLAPEAETTRPGVVDAD